MYITRRNFYGPLIRRIERSREKPEYVLRVQGTAILRIHRFEGEEARAVLAERRADLEGEAAADRILAWMVEEPGRTAAIIAALETLENEGPERLEEVLRDLLPEELQADVPAVVDRLRP